MLEPTKSTQYDLMQRSWSPVDLTQHGKCCYNHSPSGSDVSLLSTWVCNGQKSNEATILCTNERMSNCWLSRGHLGWLYVKSSLHSLMRESSQIRKKPSSRKRWAREYANWKRATWKFTQKSWSYVHTKRDKCDVWHTNSGTKSMYRRDCTRCHLRCRDSQVRSVEVGKNIS